MADKEDTSPHNMEACCMVHRKGEHPCKGTTNEQRVDHLASEMTRATGNFGTPQTQENQEAYAQAYRSSVSRMFISLGLADDIVDAIVDKQGYNTPYALSCLDKKGVKQLVTAMFKPGRMKGGTQKLRINVPLWLQEIIMGACFALKHQRGCGEKFHPSLVHLEILEELWLQQDIEMPTTTRRPTNLARMGTEELCCESQSDQTEFSSYPGT